MAIVNAGSPRNVRKPFNEYILLATVEQER
jgi:hypothetical protein